MFEPNNFSHMLKMIEQDTGNWDTISRIKEKEKLEIDIANNKDEPDHVRITQGSWELTKSLSRAINKMLFDTVADAEGTVKWLQQSRGTTKQHIQNLVHIVKDSHDIQHLSKAIDSLSALKKTVQSAANSGYDNLKQTYEGRLTQTGKKIKEILRNEQDHVCEEVVKTLSDSIILLGSKIQENKVRALLNEELSSDDEYDFEIIERSFNLLSNAEINIEELVQKSSDNLIDPYAEERWQDRNEYLLNGPPSDNWKVELLRDIAKEAEVQNPSLLCKRVLKERSPLEKMTGKKGAAVDLPVQFYKDLPRMRYFKVNDTTVYSNNQTYKYNPVEGYKDLEKAFISIDPNQGKLLAERASRLVTQTTFSDLTKQLILRFSDDDKLISTSGINQVYQINVEPNQVIFTLKVCYQLKDQENMEETLGCVLAKRTITIPLDELREEELENKDDPAPGLVVVDKFSKLIDTEAYAVELLPNF